MTLGLAALATACDRYPVAQRFPLTVEPESLVFTARQGGLPPIARFVTVSSAGLLQWTAAADVPWLAIAPGAGGVPRSVVVAPDNSGLVLGSYHGTVSFSASGASNAPVRAAIRLDIVAQVPMAGRWVAATDQAVLSLDLRDSAGVVTGTGLLIASTTPVAAAGAFTGGTLALALQPASGAPLALNAFVINDNVLRGTLTGPGLPGDSVYVFRQ